MNLIKKTTTRLYQTSWQYSKDTDFIKSSLSYRQETALPAEYDSWFCPSDKSEQKQSFMAFYQLDLSINSSGDLKIG